MFAGAHGQYDTELKVATGGAEADIGLVRFYENQAVVERADELPPPAPSDECLDGYFGSGSEPCMSGEAQVICSEDADDDSDSDSDGDSDDNEQEGDHQDGDEQEGDHQDGDQDEVEGPVAVPQYSLEGSLGCGDDDSDSDSD